jgi:hypothetical protein
MGYHDGSPKENNDDTGAVKDVGRVKKPRLKHILGGHRDHLNNLSYAEVKCAHVEKCNPSVELGSSSKAVVAIGESSINIVVKAIGKDADCFFEGN